MTNPGFKASDAGHHRHKCKFCGFVWEHSDDCDASHNAVGGSHECPGCKRCNWGLGIYEGDEAPWGRWVPRPVPREG